MQSKGAHFEKFHAAQHGLYTSNLVPMPMAWYVCELCTFFHKEVVFTVLQLTSN